MRIAAARRVRSQRGAAIVEMAMVGMIMLGLLAAAVDFGLGWRAAMAATEAARTGARVGSGQADSPAADYNALAGVKGALEASRMLDDVEQVIVFRSDTIDGAVPESCKSGTSGPCNVFTGDQFRALNFTRTTNTFNIVWGPGANDPPVSGNGCPASGYYTLAGWCPTVRVRTQASADYLGVYIRYRHDHMFPSVLGDDTIISRTAVMRLEPYSV